MATQSERERLQIRQNIRKHEEDVRSGYLFLHGRPPSCLYRDNSNDAEESENLASLGSGALQLKLQEVNDLQRQSEFTLGLMDLKDYR